MASPTKMSRWALFLASAAILVVFDIGTKEVARHKLEGNRPDRHRVIQAVPGWLHYQYTLNPGVIFGKLPEFKPYFFWLSILAVPLLIGIFWRIRAPSATLAVFLGMILAGASGNMVDRLRFSEVQDFIFFCKEIRVPFRSGSFQWAIFNLADSCILIGTILLMLELWLLDDSKKPAAPGAGEGKGHEDRPEDRPPADAPGPAGAG